MSTHVRSSIFSMTASCQVKDLGKSDQRYIMGYQLINGQPQLFSANDMLHLGDGVGEVRYFESIIPAQNTAPSPTTCEYD